MKRKRKNDRVSDIRTRIQSALDDRHWGGLDLGSILDDAKEDDVDAIKPFVPDIVAHPEWVTRADALEFVGRFHLKEFLPLVKLRLKDTNWVVRGYALTAYYDLLGREALPILEKACQAKDIHDRVAAMVLYYVETKDKNVFEKLRGILMRRRCHFTHRYDAMNTFDAFLDVGCHPEIIELFQAALPIVSEAPRAWGLDKDIPRMLDKWKRSAKSRNRKPC